MNQARGGGKSRAKTEERLKRKLKLQEIRCNLMTTEMSKLKNILSEKDKQLQESEKKLKSEEKRRKSEQKKVKEAKKEVKKVKKESEKRLKQIEAFRKRLETITETARESPSAPPKKTDKDGKPKNNRNEIKGQGLDKEIQQYPRQQSLLSREQSSEVKDADVKDMVIEPSTSQALVPITSGVNESASCSSQAGDNRLEDYFENELMCSVCHELYIKPVTLSCSHIFCAFCIEQWRKKAHRCPICRKMILQTFPQPILENLVDKVVNTMDEESKKRRNDVIKDRPVPAPSVSNERTYADFRNLVLHEAGGSLSNYSDESEDTSYGEDSEMNGYGYFQDLDLDDDLSDIFNQEYLGRLRHELYSPDYDEDGDEDDEDDDDDDDSGSGSEEDEDDLLDLFGQDDDSDGEYGDSDEDDYDDDENNNDEDHANNNDEDDDNESDDGNDNNNDGSLRRYLNPIGNESWDDSDSDNFPPIIIDSSDDDDDEVDFTSSPRSPGSDYTVEEYYRYDW